MTVPTTSPATEARAAAPAVLVVMLGGMHGGPLEQLMRRALEASALDTIEVALATGRYERALLLTDAPPTVAPPGGVAVEVDGDRPGAFHFGTRLAAAVEEHRIERLVYLGAGSGPLLSGETLEALASGRADGEGEPVECLANNYYSADLFALQPASLLARLDPPPAKDNAVPRRLRDEHQVTTREIPRTLETQLNLDTPADLAVLTLTGHGGPRLRALLAEWEPDTRRLREAAAHFTDRHAEVFVAGRVGGSRAWQYLERETACRVRLLAEERGMQAAGRDADGNARSILGQLIGAAGPDRFFAELLPELCDGAFIDLRPALIQLGCSPSRHDRFAADLGAWEQIEDPVLREIVRAAMASPVPVALGGHSLVSGALMLLNQWTWDEHDRRLGLAPREDA